MASSQRSWSDEVSLSDTATYCQWHELPLPFVNTHPAVRLVPSTISLQSPSYLYRFRLSTNHDRSFTPSVSGTSSKPFALHSQAGMHREVTLIFHNCMRLAQHTFCMGYLLRVVDSGLCVERPTPQFDKWKTRLSSPLSSIAEPEANTVGTDTTRSFSFITVTQNKTDMTTNVIFSVNSPLRNPPWTGHAHTMPKKLLVSSSSES